MIHLAAGNHRCKLVACTVFFQNSPREQMHDTGLGSLEAHGPLPSVTSADSWLISRCLITQCFYEAYSAEDTMARLLCKVQRRAPPCHQCYIFILFTHQGHTRAWLSPPPLKHARAQTQRRMPPPPAPMASCIFIDGAQQEGPQQSLPNLNIPSTHSPT